jgi:adenylate cyclase class 2
MPGGPMLEIEQKFRCPNLDEIRDRLLAAGLAKPDLSNEVDSYFNAPDRDFAVTGEAFRLRQVGDRNALTYKGPKRTDTTAKVRLEIELPVESGQDGVDAAKAMITALGFRPVATVRKSRTAFHSTRNGFAVTICLDRCEGVGSFAEIEILAEETNLLPAEQTVRELSAELGLIEYEPRSYLRMTLETLAGK